MKPVYVFVDADPDWSAVKRSLPTSASRVVVFTLGEKLCQAPQLLGKSVTLMSIAAYGPSEPEARRKTMQWLRDWTNRPILEGATIKELLIYRGLSLWWFLDPWWVLRGGTHFTSLHDTIRQLEQITDIVNREKPSRVISLCAGTEFNSVLKSVCTHCGIDASCPATSNQAKEALEKRLRELLHLVRCAGRTTLYRIQNRFAPSLIENLAGDRLLVLTGDNWGRFWDHESGEMVEGDTYLYNVLRTLKRRHSIRFVIELAARKLYIRHLRNKRRKSRILYQPYEAYLDAGAGARTLRGYQLVRDTWKRLAASSEFRESLVYDGVPCWDFFAPRLRVFFATGVLDALLSLEIAFSMVKKEQPKALIVDSRMSRFGRALIHAARCAGIPSIAMEHSFFIPDNLWDFLTVGDMVEQRRNPALGCPLPDRILVYGPRDRELMVQGHFPGEIIEVTGAPRWDPLPSLAKALNKEALCDSYCLDPKRPIVLLATQAHYPMHEEDQVFRATCVAVKQVPGAQLIVKLHPSDGTLVATKKRYSAIAKEVGLEDLVIRDGRVLYELLRISDVLVALACNTVIEAILMGKPVIVVDLFGRELYDSFLRHPALLEARSADELCASLRAIFNDSQVLTRLAERREDFVSTYCFRADGFAWKRAVRALADQIECSQPRDQAKAARQLEAGGVRKAGSVSASPGCQLGPTAGGA